MRIKQKRLISLALATAAVAAVYGTNGIAPASHSFAFGQTTKPAAKPAAPEAPVSADEMAARVAVAERFADMARLALSQRAITAPLLRENAALLEAAVRQAPGEFRFHRLLIESYLQLGDETAAAKAISTYLEAMKAVHQTDQVAQVKLIDLFVLSRESADSKIEYLKPIIAASGVPAEVRSHAAMQLARVYADRGQDQETNAAVQQAIDLSSLNLEALRTKFARIHETCTAAERVQLLLAMLRANPSQPDLMAQVANDLTDTGLINEALWWYNRSVDINGRLGRGQSLPDHLQLASALLVGEQPRDAMAEAARILQSDKGNIDAAFINLLGAKRLNDSPEAIVAAKTVAADAVQRQLTDLHSQLAGEKETPATTQPADAINGQLAADAQKLKADGGDLYGAYVAGMSKLAWYEIYFEEKPALAAKAIEALRVLLPADDVNLARLDGWSFLVAGDFDQAKVKLSAVSERDPLSALGMVRIHEKDDKAAALAELIKLSGTNASGVRGAILVEALLDRGGKFTPGEAADAVRIEVSKFPRAFLNVLDTPTDFYKIKAEPIKVRHNFGEPILANVTIENVGDYDLTLGADGVIHPDVWFDVKVLGMDKQSISGCAYDRMGQQLILRARGQMAVGGAATQLIRLDEGELGRFMVTQPTLAVSMLFSVFTNPVPTSASTVGPGPGGYRQQMSRQVERGATPLGTQQQLQALVSPLNNGTPAERIRVGELISTMCLSLSTTQPTKPDAPVPSGDDLEKQKQAAESTRQFVLFLRDTIERVSNGSDSSESARGFLDYSMAMISSDAKRQAHIEDMLRSQSWAERLLGLCAAQRSLQKDQSKPLAQKLADSDADATVKQFASSMVEWLDTPSSTQPSSQPSTEPAAAGSGMDLNPATPPSAPPSTPMDGK